MENKYTFYYDESQNVRKLYLSNKVDGYNIDHDKHKDNAVNFLLGGIAHRGDCINIDIDSLKKIIELQSNAKEFKFNHVARGDFLSVLNSRKLTGFLEWLCNSDLYVHYFNLNMEYWAYLDIVEDCILHCLTLKELEFKSDVHFRMYSDAHKNVLYNVVCDNRVGFIRLLKEYDFPYLKGRENEFMKMLYMLVMSYNIKVHSDPRKNQYEKLYANSLRELILLCLETGIDDLTLTMDIRTDVVKSDDRILVDGFSTFYQHRANQFPDSQHIFDEERIVEKDLARRKEHSDELKELKYRFVKSTDNELIQVSDVIAGFLQKYFHYLNKTKISEVCDGRKNLNEQQMKNVNLIQKLINKSDSEDEKLLFYVMSSLEHEKHIAFMYPEKYCDILRYKQV
ncbi:DUF3800 domain-containing protein [Aeromonas veronii]